MTGLAKAGLVRPGRLSIGTCLAIQLGSSGILTCGVGELILLLLYAILEGFGISSGNGNLLLDRFCASVRHGRQ